MRTLLEKDIRLLLLRKSTLVMFIIIGIIFTGSFSGSFSGAYMTMLGTLLALSTISYDDSDNCMAFLFCLPCTRKQYVAEKYLFVYAVSFLAGLIGMVIILVTSIIKGDSITSTMLLEILSSEIPIILITGGIMIPLQLKFGPEKARIVLIGIIGAMFAAAYLLSKMFGSLDNLEQVVKTLDAANPLMVALFLLAILLIITCVSVVITMKIVDNKEY